MPQYLDILGDELMELIGNTVSKALAKAGFDVEQAAALGDESASFVRETFGGTHVYLTKAPPADKGDGALRTPSGKMVIALESALFERINDAACDARSVARECALAVMHALGNGYVYVPKGMRRKFELRDERIWAEFNGANYAALAKRYGLTEMRIRQVIAKQMKLRRAARTGQAL